MHWLIENDSRGLPSGSVRHAVEQTRDTDTLRALLQRPSLCGVSPKHGWNAGEFSGDLCPACLKARTA